MITKYKLFQESYDGDFDQFDFVISSDVIYMLLTKPDKRNSAVMAINIGRYSSYYESVTLDRNFGRFEDSDIYPSETILKKLPYLYILQSTIYPITETNYNYMMSAFEGDDKYIEQMNEYVDFTKMMKDYLKSKKSKEFNL